MVNPFAETPDEKRELALHMYHNGHTWRDICREVRLSPSTLSNIIKSESGYVENSEKQLVYKNKETRALALYDKNNKPIEVAIELNIATEEAINFYHKFQEITALPLEDRKMKFQKEIEAVESAKNNANSQLMWLKNQIAEHTKILDYYKAQCEYWRNQLIVLGCQRRQMIGW